VTAEDCASQGPASSPVFFTARARVARSFTTAELKATGTPVLPSGSRAKGWCLRRLLPARQSAQQDQYAKDLVPNIEHLLLPVLGQVSGLSNENVQME